MTVVFNQNEKQLEGFRGERQRFLAAQQDLFLRVKGGAVAGVVQRAAVPNTNSGPGPACAALQERSHTTASAVNAKSVLG